MPDTTFTTIGTLLAPGIGTSIGGAVDVLKSLGISFRGKTKHLSYDVVAPKATAWSVDSYNTFHAVITDSEMVGDKGYVRCVRDRLMEYMRKWWGLNIPLNYNLITDVGNIDTLKAGSLQQLLSQYYVWVFTNVDQDSGDTVNGTIFNDLFRAIFVQALYDAGLYNKQRQAVIEKVPTGGGTPKVTPPTQATFGTPLMIGIAALVVFGMISRKGT